MIGSSLKMGMKIQWWVLASLPITLFILAFFPKIQKQKGLFW